MTSDSEIATRLVREMEWITPEGRWENLPWKDGVPGLEGIVLEALQWAQQRFGPFSSHMELDGEKPLRLSWFGNRTSHYVSADLDLTPRHLCLAILKAVEGSS